MALAERLQETEWQTEQPYSNNNDNDNVNNNDNIQITQIRCSKLKI